MNAHFLKTVLGWGIFLWLVGYLLGIVLFPLVPNGYIGWVIMPVGILVTLWVLRKKISFSTLKEYFALAIVWTLLAILLDYFLLVQLFHPADGYYKLDVYLYYLLTFLMPMGVYWYQNKIRR